MVSDRNYGLLLFDVVVRLEGYSFVTLITSGIESDYSISELFRFDFIRRLAFPEQIYTLTAKLLSSEHLVLVKGSSSANVYLVNVQDPKNPFIQRKFGNVYETDVTPFVHNSGHATLSERWVVAPVHSFHERVRYWNFYDVTKPGKLMPFQALEEEYQWIESLYWYSDSFIFKTEHSFKVGRIQSVDLVLTSQNHTDVGESAFIEVTLSSLYFPSYSFTLEVLFMPQNSTDIVYSAPHTDLILYSGKDSCYQTTPYLNGPNLNVTWVKTGDSARVSIHFGGYFRFT